MGVTAAPPERPLIIFEPVDNPPPGYIRANGALLSRSVYAWLFSRIGITYGAGDGSTTFAIPDLRGEFLRGFDDGRGVDTGRIIGSAQGSQNLEHNHGGQTGLTSHQFRFGPNAGLTPSSGNATGPSWNTLLSHSHTIVSDGGTEARPRNVAMLACIAYAP